MQLWYLLALALPVLGPVSLRLSNWSDQSQPAPLGACAALSLDPL